MKLNDVSVMFVYTKPAAVLAVEVQTLSFDHALNCIVVLSWFFFIMGYFMTSANRD